MNRIVGLMLAALLLVVLALPLAAQGDGPARVGLRPDAPEYALHGPYWVGTMEFVVEPESERPLPLTIWYPALNPQDTVPSTEYSDPSYGFLRAVGHALRDAEVDATAAPYPLVILSHGSWSTRPGQLYLTEHLASYGFVVFSVDHTGNTLANWGQSQHRHNIWRPQDILREIAFADALTADGGVLPIVIDTEQVAVVGHSFGAWTALAALGAHMNLSTLPTWCDDHPESDPQGLGLCSSFVDYMPELAELAGLDSVPEGLWPSIADSRVDTAVAMAPGTTAAFGPEGLGSVNKPALIFA